MKARSTHPTIPGLPTVPSLSGAGSSPFSPDSISGLQFWVNGDNVTEAGGVISEMIDLSPQGRITTSPSGDVFLVSNAINSHDSASFGGTAELVITPHINNSSATVFAVAAVNAASSNTYAPMIISGGMRMVAKTASSAGAWGSFTSSGDLNGTTTMAVGVWRICELTSQSGGVGTRLIMDGTQEATSVSESVGAANSCIGNENGLTRFLVGQIAEILYYDSVLSSGDRTLVRNWLEAKYNL